MPPRTQLHTFDELSGGRVITALRSWRAGGATYSDCSQRLRSEFSIEVHTTTVRRWLLDLAEAPARA